MPIFTCPFIGIKGGSKAETSLLIDLHQTITVFYNCQISGLYWYFYMIKCTVLGTRYITSAYVRVPGKWTLCDIRCKYNSVTNTSYNSIYFNQRKYLCTLKVCGKSQPWSHMPQQCDFQNIFDLIWNKIYLWIMGE